MFFFLFVFLLVGGKKLEENFMKNFFPEAVKETAAGIFSGPGIASLALFFSEMRKGEK